MSKLFMYVLGFFALILVGGFVFFAITPPEIEQQEVILEIPSERFG